MFHLIQHLRKMRAKAEAIAMSQEKLKRGGFVLNELFPLPTKPSPEGGPPDKPSSDETGFYRATP